MLNRIKIMRVTIMVSLILSLTACGFHLRGTNALFDGTNTVYIAAPDSSFVNKLHDALVASGASVLSAPDGADMVVKISNAKFTRSVGTLDERGITDSFQLRFTVSYSVLDSSSALLKEPVVLTEDRQYVFESQFVLESEQEQLALRKSMEDDISQRVVRQLSAIDVN